MLDWIVQSMIVFGGAGNYWFFGSKRWDVRRWGYVVGLAGEPFWLYESISKGQWGIVIVTGFTTAFLIRGLRNNWRPHG